MLWKHKLAEALEEGHPKENIVVCRESSSGQRTFSQMTWETFLSLNHTASTEEPLLSTCLYEVIRGCRQHKMYFDIDGPGEMYEESIEVVKTLKAIIDSLIPGAEIGVFTSSSSEKSSFHVIIDEYHVDNNAESLAFYRAVMDKFTESSAAIPPNIKVDRLYSSNQQLRVLGWSKPGKGRFKVLSPELSSERFLQMQSTELLQASLVSVVGSSSSRKISLETSVKKAQVSPSSTASLFLSLADLSSLKVALKKMKLPFKIVGPADGAPSIINLKRKSPAYCELCERLHEHENAFVTVGRDGVLRFFCRRDSSKKHMKIVLEKTKTLGPLGNDKTVTLELPSSLAIMTPSELLKIMAS